MIVVLLKGTQGTINDYMIEIQIANTVSRTMNISESQHVNVLALCFEDVEIMRYHLQITLLEFERTVNNLVLLFLTSKLGEK